MLTIIYIIAGSDSRSLIEISVDREPVLFLKVPPGSTSLISAPCFSEDLLSLKDRRSIRSGDERSRTTILLRLRLPDDLDLR